MNRYEKPPFGSEAKVKYLNSDFRVIRAGAFVRCAVTGDPIALEVLRYWNVSLQEPYRDAEIALERYRQLRAGQRQQSNADTERFNGRSANKLENT